MNAIDDITRSENIADATNLVWSGFISYAQLPVSTYSKKFLESASQPDTILKEGSKYLEETGILKYIDFLTSHENYVTLLRKEDKTDQEIEQIKKIEKSAIHGNRYRKFTNRKDLRKLVSAIFNSEQEEKYLLEVAVHEKTAEKYDNRKNFLKFGAFKIGKNFNEYALNDFLVKGAFENYKQKRREELGGFLKEEKIA